MDWTEKFKHKKKLRKMAYCMLWADFKDLVCSWKVVLLVLIYLFFFLLPYYKDMEDFNGASMYYFMMWVIMAMNALAETAFNYLPLSTRDIVYYMKTRTNHQVAWIVLVSCLTALIMDAAGVDVFWERGLLGTIFLLVTIEWMFFMTLYSYSKPYGTTFLDPCIPKARKVRIAIYNTYSIVVLFGSMLLWMFMDYNENAKIKLLVVLCVYLVMYIFRADAVRWVRFDECWKTPRRSMWPTTADQQNQQ